MKVFAMNYLCRYVWQKSSLPCTQVVVLSRSCGDVLIYCKVLHTLDYRTFYSISFFSKFSKMSCKGGSIPSAPPTPVWLPCGLPLPCSRLGQIRIYHCWLSSVKRRAGCRLQFYFWLCQFAAPDNALSFGSLGAAWSLWRVHEEPGHQQNIRT